MTTSLSKSSFNPKNFVAPLIICLEDVHTYDVFTFKIIRTLLKYFDNILFFATARTNYFEKPVSFEPNARVFSQEEIFNNSMS